MPGDRKFGEILNRSQGVDTVSCRQRIRQGQLMSVRIELNEAAAQTNNFAVGRDVVRLRGSIATLEGPARCTLVSVRAIADSKNQRVVVLVYELARRAVFGKTCARQIRDAAEFDYSIPRGARNASRTILYCTEWLYHS